MNRYRVIAINRVFLLTVLFSVLGSFINGYIIEYTGNYLLVLLTSQIILVLPSISYLLINRVRLKDAIRFNKMRPSNVILTIVFSFLIMPIMTLINAISMLFVENTTSAVMLNILDNNSLLLTLFMVAVIPSLFEESVYRGIFYNEYRKESPLKAILLSGFLFGIIHLNFNQFAYAFAMGIIFALIIEVTDSILSTMIIHLIINGNSILTLYLYPKLIELLDKAYGSSLLGEGTSAEEYIKDMTQNVGEMLSFSLIIKTYFIPALICSILAFVIFRTIAKNTGRWDYVKGIFNTSQVKNRLVSPSLIIGIIICISLMIIQEVVL
ncbi:MAG: CPBP family intramembrane metalloprotease [Clostridiales bacterium]|nr:CPBP family intramembrane metalloprotease [Clostridiales bacterium]